MTRHQARQRWCPFAFVMHGKQVINRHNDGEMPQAGKCITNDCMAWRHYETEPASGWCGLAGKEGAP